MSTKKEELFRLIQSMTKQEKRYFKMWSGRFKQEEAKYVKLFDAINKMDVYDEEKLKKKNFVKNLSKEKRDLYDNILLFLRNFNTSANTAQEIENLLRDFDELTARGEHDVAWRVLQKAHKKAHEIFDYAAILKMNNLRSRASLLFKREVDTKDIVQENKECLAKLSELSNMENLRIEISGFTAKSQRISDPKLLAELDELVEKYVSKDEMSQLSERAQMEYLIATGIYYGCLSDYEKKLACQNKISDWWNKYPTMINAYPNRFVVFFQNYLQGLIMAEKFDLAAQEIKRFEENVIHLIKNESRIFHVLMNAKIMLAANTLKIEKTETLNTEVKAGLEKHSLPFRYELLLLINMQAFTFIAEKFDICWEWSNRIIGLPRRDARLDFRQWAHLVYLICVYERKELELLDPAFRAAERYIKQVSEDPKNAYFVKAVKMLKTVIRKPDPKPGSQQLLDFLISQHGQGKAKPVGFEELLCWADSKVSGRTIIEALEYYRKNRTDLLL